MEQVEYKDCPYCQGYGFIIYNFYPGDDIEQIECDECGGKGQYFYGIEEEM